MLIYGPCTVKFNGIDLGKTYGGVTVNLDEADQSIDCIGETVSARFLKKVSGRIPLFYGEAFALFDDTTKTSPGTLEIEGSSFRVTIYNCRLKWPTDLELGVLTQQTFDLRFEALYNQDVDPLIRLEEL